MRLLAAHVLLLVTFTHGVANAEVKDVAPGGFTVVHAVTVAATRGEVWLAAVNDIGSWWSSSHTVSGDASRLSIDARPQGCFCESLGQAGGVTHLTVTFVNREVLLRMTGALGPLGLMGVDGNMLWEFDDADGATRVRFTYVVGGYSPDGLDKIADAVDYVIGEALTRMQTYVETGSPEAVPIG